MNVVFITHGGFQLVMPGIVASGAGRPPRGCFVTPAIVLDLRSLAPRRAERVAMLLPVADPGLPAGHAWSPRRGEMRWTDDRDDPPLIAAPDVLATLARRLGVRVLHAL